MNSAVGVLSHAWTHSLESRMNSADGAQLRAESPEELNWAGRSCLLHGFPGSILHPVTDWCWRTRAGLFNHRHSWVLVSEFHGRSSQTYVAIATTTPFTTRLSLATFIPFRGLSLKAVPDDWPARNPILGSVYQKIKSTAVILKISKTTFLLSLMVLVIFYFINSSSLLVTIRITRDTFISKVNQEVIFEDILRIFIVDAFNSMSWNS